jgi:hypothetical protein
MLIWVDMLLPAAAAASIQLPKLKMPESARVETRFGPKVKGLLFLFSDQQSHLSSK